MHHVNGKRQVFAERFVGVSVSVMQGNLVISFLVFKMLRNPKKLLKTPLLIKIQSCKLFLSLFLQKTQWLLTDLPLIFLPHSVRRKTLPAT